jgi:hypothetical protein
MAGPLLAFVVALMSRRRHGLDRVRAFLARLFVGSAASATPVSSRE